LFKKGEKMTWTILALIIAAVLYVFCGKLFKHDSKKVMPAATHIAKRSVKLLAIIVTIVCVARIWTPYYLTSVNPAIVMEMVKGAQAQEQENNSTQIRKHIKKNGDAMTENAPVLGNPDAKKIIFVFTDYSCPYCRRVDTELKKVLADNKDVKVVIKNFSIHGVLSDAPARAMIASKMQGCDSAKLNSGLMEKNYWPEDLQQDPSKIEATILKNVLAAAQKAGCDVEKLGVDMDGEVVSGELAQVGELAQQFGISGTPFLIVGDQAFPGAIPAAQIQEALK
jgi:protein-disulfide isomerase